MVMKLQPSRALNIGLAALSLLALAVTIYSGFMVTDTVLAPWPLVSTIVFLLLSLGCQFFVQPNNFVSGFLLG